LGTPRAFLYVRPQRGRKKHESAVPVDLRGGARAPRRFIDWETFFDFGSIARPSGTGTLGEDMRPNKLIDARISTPLFNLPLAAIPSGDRPTSLPSATCCAR
jgi:hypothetical protein